MPPVRVRFAEYLLAISAIVVTYLGAEAAFSLVGLSYVPLRLQGNLPAEVRVFAQSSKTGVVPRNPVLLLGDSYAQGLGDWLLETDHNRNGPFHSAHVINRLTGRDVVTLGVGGAGSPEGMATLPAVAYGFSKHAWYLRLPPPHIAVVYFYEGNDLNDNMRWLSRIEGPDEANAVERIDRSIDAYSSRFFGGISWKAHFPLSRFSARLVKSFFAELTSAESRPGHEPSDVVNAAPSDQPNIVEVAGRAMELPPICNLRQWN